MKKLLITKKDFLEICSLIKKQNAKDEAFCDFMEKYLDGRFVPMMNEHFNLAIEKLMNVAFDDTVSDDYGYTWWSWFVYECDFGKKKMEARLLGKPYIISSPEKFYDFMKEWVKQK